MDTRTMINQLKYEADKHRNDRLFTGQTNITALCNDVIPKLEKLAEYEDAEENGLLVRYPCKVGDYIWDIDFGRPCAYEITGFSVGNLNDDYCDDEQIILDEVIVYYSNSNGSITGRFAESEIGKTVFLTEEAAKERLKEVQNE